MMIQSAKFLPKLFTLPSVPPVPGGSAHAASFPERSEASYENSVSATLNNGKGRAHQGLYGCKFAPDMWPRTAGFPHVTGMGDGQQPFPVPKRW